MLPGKGRRRMALQLQPNRRIQKLQQKSGPVPEGPVMPFSQYPVWIGGGKIREPDESARLLQPGNALRLPPRIDGESV